MPRASDELSIPWSRRPILLLSLGLVIGVVLAGVGLMSDRRQADAERLSGNAAVVNGTPISMTELQRAIAALEADRTEPLDVAETHALLDRLIDEELLVQRGTALGFLQHDRRIRSELTSAVITSVVSETELREPGPQQLRAFYDRNRDLFATPGRLRVRQIFIAASEGEAGDDAGAVQQVDAAARRLREGVPFERVRADLGDEEAAVVPNALLPPTKLAEYLGAPIVRSIMAAKAGSVSGPWRSTSGYHIVEIRERESAKVPSFERIEEQVRDAYQREQGDAALTDYLAALRANSEILVGEPPR